MKKTNVILIGMRGSGKSTTGKLLAEKMGKRFFDADEEIEKRSGASIAEIVSKGGWNAFRKLESEVCEELGKKHNAVIATGGGAVLKDENMEHLKKNGICIFLFADISLLVERIKKDTNNRPSLTKKNNTDELWDIWSERKNLYGKAADVVIDSHEPPEKIVDEILEEWSAREEY